MSETTDGRAVRWILEGIVQGVGFRYFTRRTAKELGIRGWVRNLSDGTVEIVAAARPEALERLESSVRRGPHGARVDDVTEAPVDARDVPPEFEVRY